MIDRSAILDAIVARVASVSAIKSVSRDLKMPDQVGALHTPCAYVSCTEISYTREHARDPGTQRIDVAIYVYVFGRQTTSLSARLLSVVGDIEATLRGQPTETCAYATTLGETVLSAEVTRIELDEGQLDETHGIAVITVDVTTKGS
jgi:hypothetical protein